MARPRRDGRPSRPITKHKLSDAYVRNLRPAEDHWYLTWDSKISGLAIAVHPTGKKTWKVVYQFNRKPRWLTIGPFDIVDVDKARRLAGEILLKVVTGIDAQAERQASRGASTFEEAHRRYVTEYAQKTKQELETGRHLGAVQCLAEMGQAASSRHLPFRCEVVVVSDQFSERGDANEAGDLGGVQLVHRGGDRRREGQPVSAHRYRGLAEP